MSDWSVVIAERGFIFAGRTHRDGDQLVIEDAYQVLRFSHETRDGLGGLAQRGPSAGTGNDSLVPSPAVRIHVLAIVATIEANDSAWSEWHTKAKK